MTDHTTPEPERIDALMTIEEVAELLRMPLATVRYWRVLGTGPRGFILGRRLRYFRQDVLDWLDEQREATGRGAA
ncbi:helix-turn-helix domain-containing protein [Nocardioides donggukensis]|uniref:Helix-turn-helix domain-containing protein n=1 Tax=Nocardioides donggukensis TaxID=2774019 RepID=A0A927Q2Q8_9ACTN|nr:helix-turn-helix domain-containing protein [Nocardioides donggukensis]MBD8869881.1 helix-turn-helix domain-containing protein [Nocardioides donggukensis]